MNKKVTIWVASSLMLMGCATASFAAKTGLSPFSDNLTLTLSGFPSDTIFNAIYVDDNGINISGPAVFNSDSPAMVTIASDNKVENGDPSMMMQYPTIFGTQTCALDLADGPLAMLHYKEGSAPICAGITVSSITLTSQYNYTATITDNEP